MSELSPAQKAIQDNKIQPHLDNFEIVLELAKTEDRLDALENKEAVESSPDIQSLKDSIIALENGLIDGLTKQVNYLQDKVKELEQACLADVGTTEEFSSGPGTGNSEINPFNPETATP